MARTENDYQLLDRLTTILDKYVDRKKKSTYERYYIDNMLFAGDLWFLNSLDMEELENFVLENFEHFMAKTSAVTASMAILEFRKRK